MLVAECRLYSQEGETYEGKCTWGITDYDTGMFYPFGYDQTKVKSIVTNIEAGKDKITRYCGKNLITNSSLTSSPQTVVEYISITVSITTNGRRFKNFDKDKD